VGGCLLLQRWINRMALSLFGSANLVRPGLCPNGPSNIASRHRLRRTQRQGHASTASRRKVIIHFRIKAKRAGLDRHLQTVLAWASARPRVNDCKAIGGPVGGKDCPGGWAGEKSALGGHSALPQRETSASSEGTFLKCVGRAENVPDRQPFSLARSWVRRTPSPAESSTERIVYSGATGPAPRRPR